MCVLQHKLFPTHAQHAEITGRNSGDFRTKTADKIVMQTMRRQNFPDVHFIVVYFKAL